MSFVTGLLLITNAFVIMNVRIRVIYVKRPVMKRDGVLTDYVSAIMKPASMIMDTGGNVAQISLVPAK